MSIRREGHRLTASTFIFPPFQPYYNILVFLFWNVFMWTWIHIYMDRCVRVHMNTTWRPHTMMSSRPLWICIFINKMIMLRPTPWRMLLEFHLIDFAVMSAEHDVSAKPLSRKVPTKRHAVSYKLSRWDASDSHLISLTLLHVHSSRRALAHSINLHFPSLPPYYNILVFFFISILSFLINLSAFLLYNLRPRHSPVSMNS